MRILIRFLVIILIYGVLGFINYKIKCSDKKNKANQVHLPKIIFWIGFLCDIVFITFLICSYLLPKIFVNMNLVCTIGFIMFILLGIIIMIQYYNCRIDICNDEFIYHTFWGRKYKFYYSEIKKVKRTQDTIHLFTAHKHLYIDRHAEGIDEFFKKF